MRLAGTKLAANHQYRGFGDQLYDLSGERPSLDLNFANTKSLVDATTGQNLVTFTRASSGTYVDSQGVIRTATTNEPRFDHNPTTGESLGLLVEEQRTNLLVRSEEFNDAVWGKVGGSITADAITAPNGQTTADLFTENTVLTQHDVRVTSPTLTDGVTYTLTVYSKTNGRRLNIIYPLDTAGHGATFDLINGTFTYTGNTVTATIQPVGDGWYRCSCTATKFGGSGTSQLRFLTHNGTTNNYTGDGTSGIYLWGAQLEAGAFPTSYIPTTTATATRSADVASIAGSNFSSWYRQDEGTVFSEFSAAAYSTASYAISDGTNSNRILVDRGSAGTRYVITNAGVAQSGGAQTPYTLNSFAKTSLGYALDNCNLAVGGVLQTLDTSATIPSTTDRLLLGVNAGGAGYGNGPIKRFTFWPRRLSDPTLQQITQ